MKDHALRNEVDSSGMEFTALCGPKYLKELTKKVTVTEISGGIVHLQSQWYCFRCFH